MPTAPHSSPSFAAPAPKRARHVGGASACEPVGASARSFTGTGASGCIDLCSSSSDEEALSDLAQAVEGNPRSWLDVLARLEQEAEQAVRACDPRRTTPNASNNYPTTASGAGPASSAACSAPAPAWVARSLPAAARSSQPASVPRVHLQTPARALPHPSHEQQEVIKAVRMGHCVAVSSVAGSGKTTCMLQVATSLPDRYVTIVAYNRSLRDECVQRIRDHGLDSRVRCYTIHGLASKCADRTLNDDTKLMEVVGEWDRGVTRPESLRFGLLMVDEAQDLRPSFFRALRHILLARTRGDGPNGSEALQMCVVGDAKQLLYDLATYGEDKAIASYLETPRAHWQQFTQQLPWVQKRLSVSYRLTAKVAGFINAVWGTDITGGNTSSANVPVEYYCRYPYPGTAKVRNRFFLASFRINADRFDKTVSG
jgi:hypothetical protein